MFKATLAIVLLFALCVASQEVPLFQCIVHNAESLYMCIVFRGNITVAACSTTLDNGSGECDFQPGNVCKIHTSPDFLNCAINMPSIYASCNNNEQCAWWTNEELVASTTYNADPTKRRLIYNNP